MTEYILHCIVCHFAARCFWKWGSFQFFRLCFIEIESEAAFNFWKAQIICIDTIKDKIALLQMVWIVFDTKLEKLLCILGVLKSSSIASSGLFRICMSRLRCLLRLESQAFALKLSAFLTFKEVTDMTFKNVEFYSRIEVLNLPVNVHSLICFIFSILGLQIATLSFLALMAITRPECETNDKNKATFITGPQTFYL